MKRIFLETACALLALSACQQTSVSQPGQQQAERKQVTIETTESDLSFTAVWLSVFGNFELYLCSRDLDRTTKKDYFYRHHEAKITSETSWLADDITAAIGFINSYRDETPHPIDIKEYPEAEETGEKAQITREVIDETTRAADEAWQHFSALCTDGKFREAYDYYNADKHSDAIMVAMSKTQCRYTLIKDIVFFLDKMFDPGNAYSKLRSNLTITLELMRFVVSMSDGEIVPAFYWEALTDLIVLHVANGDYESATKIVETDMRDCLVKCGFTAKFADGLSNQIIATIAERKGIVAEYD